MPVSAIAVGPEADKEEVQQMAAATGGSGHRFDDPAQIHSVVLKAIMEAGSHQRRPAGSAPRRHRSGEPHRPGVHRLPLVHQLAVPLRGRGERRLPGEPALQGEVVRPRLP